MKNRVEGVFVLAVFVGFALCVLLVIMHSAIIYANINEISRDGQNERILMSYIRTKIRSADSAGAVSVGSFDGISALFLEESFHGREFVTKIFLYDGVARELFVEQGGDFMPADGVPIIPTALLEFEAVEDGLIRVITNIGGFLIFPRS